ncbi:hypothetical protein Bca4012_024272 [Brassica carinata]|uniref:Serine-threonine/tyrosine-protein kinase catalytic domain-containing protein n=1 Tax=Brassica carinata TaxID=52824 RepID=A0A8X7NT19_BRACI|nr:hypothetical protein Bca52824_091644 [Brassica carinata]
MSWLRTAVSKAVEVKNYADSVVQQAGQAVAEGAKLFQDRILIREEEEEEAEEWELDRFSYEDLSAATDSFSNDRLLGFGKVYRGVLSNSNAVKCVNHDSKQGLREFMAKIESMGRLQHKNLVQMRGWCRRKNELMLVYDYMPN